MSISKEQLEALKNRIDSLKSKQANVLGIYESKQAEKAAIRSKLEAEGVDVSKLTLEGSEAYAEQAQQAYAELQSKLDSWSTQLDEFKAKISG